MRVISDLNTWCLSLLLGLLWWRGDQALGDGGVDVWRRAVELVKGRVEQACGLVMASMSNHVASAAPPLAPPTWVVECATFGVLSWLVLGCTFVCLATCVEFANRLGWLRGLELNTAALDERGREAQASLVREAQRESLVQWMVRPFLLSAFYAAVVRPRYGPLDAPFPSLRTALPQLFVCMLVDDTWFYWAHRVCHEVPFLYRNIHKKHHRFFRTTVWAVEFAHPLEDLFVNTTATMLGGVVQGAHPGVIVLYAALKLYQSTEAHCGYAVKFPLSIGSLIDSMDASPAHHYHHAAVTSNYGGWFMFWDWVCGTDAKYRAHITVNKGAELPAYAQARRPYANDAKWPSIMLVVKETHAQPKLD